MKNLRFFGKLSRITLARLCRRQGLLAVLIALCLCLPLCIAPAAEQLFSQGVSFSGITLGVTSPDGDAIPALLEELLPQMQDVSAYCQIRAMEQEEAVRSMERGDVTAVLVLPENFIQGILDGTNPDVELLVPSDRPLESLLTLWVGQSATDLLSSIQSAIYAVLDLYSKNPPAELDYTQVVSQINLRYINWTLNRQDLFRVQKISVTGLLPIGTHYGLSLLCFLLLAMAPFFFRIYEPAWFRAQQRFLAVGQRPLVCWLSSIRACWVLLFGILLTATLLLGNGNPLLCAAVCALCGLFCAAFVCICCLLAGNIGTCGILSSLLGLVFLGLSGGILPPVMLPQAIRSCMGLSPVSWMRSLLAYAAKEGEFQLGMFLALLGCTALLLAGSNLLYRRRFVQEVRKQ